MAITLTWHGHGAWSIQAVGFRLLLDPFFTDNPAAIAQADQVEADFILVSHGHFDHVGDTAAIAHRTGATVIAAYEVCAWLQSKHGVQKVEEMNLGGTLSLPFGRVKMTLAHHSSQLPDGSYGGNPGGFLLELEGKRLYFACDTALFLDMELISRGGLDLAVLPIGDRYTMGPDDALEAVKILGPRRAAPAHYNTWPPIAQDPHAWAARVRQETIAEPLVFGVGETKEI